MRIAFVTSHYENLAIEYLSALVKRDGHETALFFEPALFHNFFYDSNFLHDRFFNFRAKILTKLAAWKPDVIAFSVISDNYRWTLEMAREAKRLTGARIIFGGVHPTSSPDRTLAEGTPDFIVVGEAEGAFPELINALAAGADPSAIANAGGRGAGGTWLNPPRPLIKDLDSLPFPDKDLFFDECALLVKKSYMITASRGCNSSCSYCWNSMIRTVYPEGFFRRRSPENTIAELAWAAARYGIERVTFYDEVFTSDKAWLERFLELYKEKIKLPFFCCVHPDNVDEGIVRLLEEAGCSAVNIGLQTANEDTRRRILNRAGTNASAAAALDTLGRSGIYVYSNIMLGLPGETERDAEETLLFCARHKADLPAIYWLRYYPGTRIVGTAEKMGILSGEQVKKINDSLEYLPYAITGSTFSPNIARLGNLILLSGFLPLAWAETIVRRKLYRFMPAGNLLFPAIALTAWFKKFLKGKSNPFHYLSVSDYLKLYATYIFRRVTG